MPDAVLEQPAFVIIGAMKCATSTLHVQLARQPGIFMSEPKEPNFFSDERNWRRGLSWYASLFAGAPAGALCGEASTHYTKLPTYPRCAERLHAALPHARLVYVMRDPIERIVSHFVHAWSMRDIPADMTIDTAVQAHPELIAYSRYHMQLEPYLDRFGFEPILPVFAERLRAFPQQELERVCRHIGHTGPATWSEAQQDQNIGSRRQRTGPVLRALLRVRVLQRLRRTLLPSAVRRRIRARWTLAERPVLSDASIRHVCDALDPDLALLGRLLGRPLSCEGFRAAVTRDGAPDWAAGAHTHG